MYAVIELRLTDNGFLEVDVWADDMKDIKTAERCRVEFLNSEAQYVNPQNVQVIQYEPEHQSRGIN